MHRQYPKKLTHLSIQKLFVKYANGQGVTKDYVCAHMWFNICASSGDKNAVSNRDKVAKKITPTQIEKAQEMATRCQSSNYKNCD